MTTASSEGLIIPDWPVPSNVFCRLTTRLGGASRGAYASMNLGAHVGDDPSAVSENRRRLARTLPAEPLWLAQTHGIDVVRAEPGGAGAAPAADAAYTRAPATVCAVLTADCLPVLFCDRAGSVVAAAHAGWRGLLAGILEATAGAMAVPAGELLAYLGPAIGPRAFEVGDDVRSAFVATGAPAAAAFAPLADGKWLADLYLLARQRLAALGVAGVYGGGYCTFGDVERFFSYRRDGVTGRMATLIWLGER